MNEPKPAELVSGPRRILGLKETVSLIVGIVIGAGIFRTPALIAGMTGRPEWMFAAWALGGMVSFIGALCYAELASTYPHAGGDYHFLYRAYGRSVAFLFGWARLSVITTGSIALLAFVFGEYMNHALPLTLWKENAGAPVYAVVSVLVLFGLNRLNVRTSMATQTGLVALQALSLLFIVGTAVFLAQGGGVAAVAAVPLDATDSAFFPPAFGLGMVFVLLTYGGWNEAAYISAEIRGGRRSIFYALALSILIITLVYLLMTWAYWQGLGMTGMAASQAIAADMMRQAYGAPAERLLSLMIAISVLTSINGTMIVGARTSYAVGRDWSVLCGLGVWDARRDTPANALWVQCIAALFLIGVGVLIGGGFKSMVEFTAPVFWFFFLLTGLALFILRYREPKVPRPFKTPLYPLIPLIFCATCAYMLYSSLSFVYDHSLGGMNAAWIGVAVMLPGVLLLLLARLAGRKNLR